MAQLEPRNFPLRSSPIPMHSHLLVGMSLYGFLRQSVRLSVSLTREMSEAFEAQAFENAILGGEESGATEEI